MGTGGQWLQYLIIILFLGFSALSWLVRKLQEQKAIKEMRDRELRRQESFLRTGRQEDPDLKPSLGPPDQTGSDLDRLREIIAREEARKQGRPATAPSPAAPAGQPGGPITAELWPGGPVVVISPGGAPTAPPTPAPVPVAPTPTATPRRTPPVASARPAGRPPANAGIKKRRREGQERPAAPSLDEYQRKAAVLRRQAEQEDLIERRQVAAKQAARLASQARTLIPRTAEEWRRAIIASELLARPVSLRQRPDSGSAWSPLA
jgi:hypothetical protein